MPQIEAHGAAKLRQCACACPVAFVHPIPDDVVYHAKILHMYLSGQSLCLFTSGFISGLIFWHAISPESMLKPRQHLQGAHMLQAGCRRVAQD